jgi:hypothetical protein
MQAEPVREGDLVTIPGGNIGIVVGIYGLGYCEVLINNGPHRARVMPYRQVDLVRLPAKQDALRGAASHLE